MGVNTDFRLTSNKELDQDALSKNLFSVLMLDTKPGSEDYSREVEYVRGMVIDLLHDTYYGRWYSHVADMKNLSLVYPQVIFTLECTGDGGNSWYEYYLNGKTVKYTKDRYIDWLVSKLGGNRDALFKEWFNTQLHQ